MRKGVAGLCSLCITGGLLAWIPAPRANARVGVIDKELLGVRLLQSYKRVLQLYGQPSRIYRADEVVNFIFATDATGKQTGGVTGLGDASSAGGGGGGVGGPGVPGSGGSPGGGLLAPPPSKGGGALGAPGGGGSSLGGASGSSDKPVTFAESGGFIWVYLYPRDELAYRFAFNPDGRCVSVWERGRFKGLPTERGIRLGDPATKVYGTYGWPDSVDQQTTNVALNYNIRHHAQISLLNGKVVGIAVFLSENQVPHLMDSSAAGGGGGLGAPGVPNSGGGGGGRQRPGLSTSGGGGGSAGKGRAD